MGRIFGAQKQDNSDFGFFLVRSFQYLSHSCRFAVFNENERSKRKKVPSYFYRKALFFFLKIAMRLF